MINSIVEFNEKVLGIVGRPLDFLSYDEINYLDKAILEERNELLMAHGNGDLAGVVDAILDLCYFAIGGLHRMGLTPEEIGKCFQTIHASNMLKKTGTQLKRGGKAIDAVKPPGWVPPEEVIAKILKRKG
jgi:predicted HAD superfamily Cof-like phosphohydrolase